MSLRRPRRNLEHNSEELLAALVESASDALIAENAQGQILTWNHAAEKLLGFQAAEAIGRPISLILSPGSAQTEAEIRERLEQGADVATVQTERLSKYGVAVEVHVTVTALRDRRGHLVGCAHAMRAAQPRKRQNAEAEAARRCLRTYSEAVPDIIWTAASDGSEPYVSANFFRYTGFQPDRMTRANWIRCVHPEDRETVLGCWHNAKSQASRLCCEFRFRRFDGHFRWFALHAAPTLSAQGEIVGWVGNCTDIHESKRTQQEMQRSHEELRQFAFAAAHDLQEPLRNVANCISMLKRQYGPVLDEGALEWVNASVEGAQRIHQMVKDLLNYSTILDVPGGAKLHSDVAAALQKVSINLSGELADSGAEIRVRSAPIVALDFGHLVCLFQELIGNAVKYRRPEVPCLIELTAERVGSFWRFTVKDNGIGFDPVYSDRIFGVFKRLHPRGTYPGNGIGLAICERIVRHYGGRIWAHGQLDSGAAFHFLLPAGDATPVSLTA